MYFWRITAWGFMTDASCRGEWYSALFWARRYITEGGTLSREYWEKIIAGCVMLDELGYDYDFNDCWHGALMDCAELFMNAIYD